MSGVMSNIQYMPSPHGVSKRVRLHLNEPFSNNFQEIGQYGCPGKENLPDNVEILKTTHVWMRNRQFKEERNAFLVSGGDGEQSNGTFGDTVVQSLSFPDSNLRTTIKKETVKQSFDRIGSNLLNVCKDANNLSMPTESKCTSTTQRNDMNSFTSSTVLHSQFEARFKDKLSGIVNKSSSVMTSLDKSKGSPRKDQQSDTNTLKGNTYEHNTSKLSKFNNESEYQNNSAKSKTNSSEYFNILHSNDNYLEKIKKMVDITITPVEVKERKYQKMDENLNESNGCQNEVFNCAEEKFEVVNADLIKHFNFEIKVLPWKAYSSIVKRLPDYKLFSDVIQKAMQKVKRPKIIVEPISSEESTLSNKAVSSVTKNVKVVAVLHEDTIAKSKQKLLLRDLDEFDFFLDFVISKIQEMILLVRSTSDDIKLLDSDSEDILVALHHIQNIEYLAKIEGKMSMEDTNIVISTRNEILTLGDQLLRKIGLLELDWMDIHKTYKMNLVTISRFVYSLCLIPIERKLIYQRDVVFGAVNLIENQIRVVEVKEKELDIRRDSNFSKMMELQNEISRFYRLDEILDELCQKYFD